MNLFLASAREWNLTFRMFSLETNWGAGACQGGNPTPEWKSEPLWVRISICVCARHIEILGHINPSVKPKVFGQKPNLAWLVLDRDHPEHFCPTRQFCLNQSSTCHGWCWLLGEAWRGSSTLLKHILGSLPKNAAFFRGSMWAFLSLIVFMGTGSYSSTSWVLWGFCVSARKVLRTAPTLRCELHSYCRFSRSNRIKCFLIKWSDTTALFCHCFSTLTLFPDYCPSIVWATAQHSVP